MKRLLTVLAIFMTLICGSAFLVSCSNNYKKMSLVVEYCVSEKDENGKWIAGEWETVTDGQFDYFLSSSNSKRLHLRVKVKGTSKKVNSLYVSQSVSSSIIPETREVEPNEAFEMIVNTIGSSSFTITPSQGGEDKAVSFSINVYRELSSISQNSECVPAAVVGGYVRLEDLSNLITYQPIGETNQTGVDFSLIDVGTLYNDGNKNLIARNFVSAGNYTVSDDGNEIRENNDANKKIRLDTSRGFLMLDVSYGYALTTSNNVVKLKATSKYNKDITTDVYVYIVENFKSDSLLVSYSPNVQLEDGIVPTNPDLAIPIPDADEENIIIYNYTINDAEETKYNQLDIYTYTNASIYSYESNPGIDLRVYINNERYYYDFDKIDNLTEDEKLGKYQEQLRRFGIQVSPITRDENGITKLVGLKFETNPTALTQTNTYNIRLELDFTAFDFTASGKTPANELRKDFVIEVKDLASGFNINNKSYSDNVDINTINEIKASDVSTITGYNSTKPAKLYTSYAQDSIGMPLNIQAVPNNAINSKVYVGFYENITYFNGMLNTGTNLALGTNGGMSTVQLLVSGNYNMPMHNGEYEINFNKKDRVTYLKFNELADINNLKEIYMVCRVKSSPDSFKGEDLGADKIEFINFVAKIKVVGSISDVLVFKNTSAQNELTDKYLATATNNKAYINFSSIAGEVDYSEIVISSSNGNVKFSADGVDWKNSITADILDYVTNEANDRLYVLYFRTESECTDFLIISSPNGVGKQYKYEFVNVVNNTETITIDYDDTYIKTFDEVDKVDIEGTTIGEAINLRYLALQSGRTVQFRAYGDNSTSKINSVEATSLKTGNDEYSKITKDGTKLYMIANLLPTYNSGAILEPSDEGKFFFDVTANSTGFTAILLVKVDFYAYDENVGEITLQSKYFLYEVAVYTPATKLNVGAEGGNDKIVYINENYPEVAKATFNIGLNSATKSIAFSSSSLNQKINTSYGMSSGTSIYGIEIDIFEYLSFVSEDGDKYLVDENKNKYFEITGLNIDGSHIFVDNNTRKLSIKALQSLEPLQKAGINSIYFDVVIYQFGEEISTTKERAVLYFDDYNKSENIVVSSGIDSYNNIYLSLAGGDAICEVEAYATNSLGNVTYGELGCRIYQIDSTTNLSVPYVGNDLVVTYNKETNTFIINAKNKGGLYQLELYAKDSGSEPYLINITVSDGKSSATAYLINSLDDFTLLATTSTEGNFYRLRQDINISALGKNWWDSERVFAGTLDGAMTINNPQTGETVYRRYSLMDLNLTNISVEEMTDANTFGLFSVVTGTIKNVILTNAKINVELSGENTSSNTSINIGVIAGVNSGIIENCSVNIASSVITLKNSASNTTYNIGLMAGLNKAPNENNGKIIYNSTTTGSNYSRLVDVGNNAGKLTINVEKGNDYFAEKTNINIGGVVGFNSVNVVTTEDGENKYLAEVRTDYQDKTSNNIRDKIKVVANIEVNVEYDASYAPMNINELNVGGIAGSNAGHIANIAVSGRIVANDKVNLGGIVGLNTGNIQEVANYGAYIKGEILIEGYKTIDNETLIYHSYTGVEGTINQEQNVGGIIGYNNAGTVDNVRVMFITFVAGEVSVEGARTLIQGFGNVAGVIGKATNTQLQHAYVENFVEDVDNLLNYNILGSVNTVTNVDNTIKSGANVAGLIASVNNSSATLAFVKADFSVVDCIFYEFGNGLTYEYVYFIGDVLSGNPTAEKVNHNSIVENSYIIKNIVNTTVDTDAETGEDVTTITKTVCQFGVDDITISTVEPTDDAIYWIKNVDEGVNDGQPYLLYKKGGEIYFTLTIRPTEIIVNVDQNYFDQNAELEITNKAVKYEDGVYIQYVDNNATADNNDDDRIVATAIVYYVEDGNNTYVLVSDNKQKGLIEKTVLPNIDGVDGTYSVGIVSGSSIAVLTDNGKTITFNGVGRVELKFVSVFDRSKEDTVVIFVENPLHNDVFSISASAGIEDVNSDGSQYVTRVGANSILSLGLIAVNGQVFDSTKTYMNATIGSGIALKTVPKTDELGNTVTDENGNIIYKTSKESGIDVSDYFKLNAITEEVASGKYKLGQFNVVTEKLDSTYSYLEIPVTINVYLNLEEYYINGVSLSTLFNQDILLATKTITITIYNKPTDLTVSSNIKAESGEDVDIVAKLTTGYINSNNTSNSIKIDSSNITGSKGNKALLNIVGQDTIDLVLTAGNDNANKLLEQEKLNSNINNFSIWYLFDTIVTYKLFDNGLGYTYSINLKLKDEYRNLSLEGLNEREWIFNLNISATENVNLTKDVVVSFVPQQLISLRLENYSNLVATVDSNNTTTVAEFKSSQTESSLIVPGESGLVKIFADYSYSYFEDISITSSTQIIDGKEYFVRFQQMVYNKDKGVYESYAGITAEGQTLTLKKVSYNENGKDVYDGVLFVRTILDEFVGVRQIFTMTINATTYDLNGNTIALSKTKTVISQYRPGVYMSVENAVAQTVGDTQVYLVEKDSSVSTVVARIYGYELNIQPTIKVVYEKGVDKDGNPIEEDVSVEDVALVQKGEITLDSTGAYIIRYTLAVNTPNKFKVKMQMTLIDNGNSIVNTSKELEFYPMEYIVKDVYVQGEANGGLSLAVNSSRNLELVFDTYSTTKDKRNNISEKIKDFYLQLFYINQVNSSGQDYKKTFNEYLNSTNTNFTIKQTTNGKYFIEAKKKASPIVVYFNLWYGYDLENCTVKFRAERNEQCTKLLSYDFRLILTMETSEDAPQPINNVADLMSMAEGENYILMEDLILENWTPLDTAIASLDGNGKRIDIVSFNIPVEASVNAGLFSVVSENTILKNIVINIGSLKNNLDNTAHVVYVNDENIANVTVNFGLLAAVNKGLIYNCEIVSINTMKTVKIDTGINYNLTFGALVGVNEGNITNSRVGTEYFEQLTYVNNTVNSSILKCGKISFKAQGIVAGFVGQNNANCTISSSFVANTSIENTAVGSSDVNRTAGFVATNSGTIAYSYVKGLEKNILTTKSTTNSKTGGSECVILASGNGNVAGFAYLNTGNIHDCYSNTICKSTSSGAAGFVYNTSKGVVYQCYSATKVESGSTNTALATELPFVGVGVDKAEAQQLLSNEDMLNCYYLDDGTEYDTNYILPVDAIEPKGLTLENFATYSNLNNFSFITDSTSEQQLNGVWTYSTAVDRNRSTYSLSYTALPELTSANMIARSLRYLPTDEEWINDGHNINDAKQVIEVAEYRLGSQNNPYIIRNADEYHSVFVNSDRKPLDDNKCYMVGYVRFVDDISFGVDKNDYINVETRTEYILGDRNDEGNSEPSFTLVDGNGMTISDVVINHTTEEEGNLGLFSEVYNSVIKGLNIEYRALTNDSGENLVASSTASYVGGVAGIAKNTYLIDLNLSGSIILRAKNVVGGVVGIITGENSGLYNITSNLSVQSGRFATIAEDSIEYNPKVEVGNLSYAGGIAGIVDIGHAQNIDSNFNLNKLTTNGVFVRADRAGGIAGYLSEDVNANRLTYTISSNSQVFGHDVAGAIVGDNYADIKLSQANSDMNTQYGYDKKFAEYIKDSQIVELNNQNAQYGNLSVVTGDDIVGGFVGINNGGKISNSLTKAHISNNNVFGNGINVAGGFVGQSYGGDLEYVYAQNYIDLIHITTDINNITTTYKTSIVGGIIGEAKYDASKKYSSAIGLSNVVSANWFDKVELDGLDTKNQTVDYLIGKLNNVEVEICKKSSEIGSSPIINYGIFNVGDNIDIEDKIDNNHILTAQYYQMEDLYYIGTDSDDSGRSTQQDIFNTLFAVWPEDYWVKDYTKFMPNLKLDNATGYIKISSAEDIALMEQLPDRNFILVNNVEVTVDDSNYVVNSDFRGILIAGLNEKGDAYYQFDITLKANTSRGNGAGFFKQTTGARIANIGFNYNVLELAGNGDYSMVGGVSAQDNGSRFEQVVVKSAGTDILTTTATVSTLGSIVGAGTRSKIISSTSSIGYNVATDEVSNNIGGLVGSISGYNEERDEQGNIINAYDGLITSSEYYGHMKVSSEAGVNIGGIVGYATYTRISDCKVMQKTTDNGEVTYDALQIEVKSNNGNNNIGGIAGVYDNCSIAYSNTNINVTDLSDSNLGGTPNNKVDITYNVGGIVGLIGNSQEGIDNSYSTLSYNLVKTNNVYIGGIVGVQKSTSSINLDTLVSQVNVTVKKDDKTAVAGDNIIGKMVVGGIVGLTSESPNNITDDKGKVILTYGTIINNAMSIIDADIDYNDALYGGGLIGQAIGSYSINNSTATGHIWANNAVDTHFTANNTPTLTVLGGLVGLSGKETNKLFESVTTNQAIKYSYTTLTLSTANVYQGDVVDIDDASRKVSHAVYTNGVVGYETNRQPIEIQGVLYSSDYTLTLEEGNLNGNKFTTEPQNVTANLLINNENTLNPKTIELNEYKINGYIGESWIWANNYLPLPLAVKDMLVDLEVLYYQQGSTNTSFKDAKGKSYSPIIINDEEEFAKTEFDGEYSYYLLRCDVTIESSKVKLNGVLLGNAQVLESKKDLFAEITLHSAVSNVTVNLTYDFSGTSAVATTNNGTVFMVGVQYDNAIVSGGIVETNNGTISYCYNTGNSTGDGAGLVRVNSENASIGNSYFTGSFNAGTSGYGLVQDNTGYIANSYSAGTAKGVIGDSNGRYKNVKYDYYANYVLTDEYDANASLDIIGLSTRELQSITNIADSAIFNGWKVYSMHNWDSVNGNTNENVYSTYNYGYPIHKFKQLTFKDGKTENVQIRVKQTGDGTFSAVADINGEFLTNITDGILAQVKGKLVEKTLQGGEATSLSVYYDNFSFLINNLGVFDLINTISDTTGKYFELEIDMEMPNNIKADVYKEDNSKLLSAWKGIGTSNEPFNGVFTTTSSTYETNKNGIPTDVYTLDTKLMDETKDETTGINFNNTSLVSINETPKTIKNLTGGALFNCVGDGAFIANINLFDSKVISAPLINNVGNYEGETTLGGISKSTIYNVRISGEVTANSNTAISGLANVINQNAELYVYSVTNENIVINSYNDNIGVTASNIAGAFNVNNGTINIKASFTENQITFKATNATNVAGMININNGTINVIQSFETNSITVSSTQDSENSETGETTSIVAGMINVNTGTINIVDEGTIDLSIEALNSRHIAGFVYNNGTKDEQNAIINFVKSIKLNITSQSGNNMQKNALSVSGLVNTNYGQILTIDEANSTIVLEPIGSEDTRFIAGLVGTMNGGLIAGFEVEFSKGEEGDAYVANTFGGVVAYLNNGQLGLREDGSGDEVSNEISDKIIKVKLTTATASVFGGIVAIVGQNTESTEALNPLISNVEIGQGDGGGAMSGDSGEQITIKGAQGVENTAYGLIIGKYFIELGEINYKLSNNITFVVNNGVNVGAIIGYAENERFNFINECPEYVVTVKGFSNVGGFIGRYAGEKSLSFDGEAKYAWAIGGSESAKQFASIEFAELKKSTNVDGVSAILASNFGGLIGYWNTTAELTHIANIDTDDEFGRATLNGGERILIVNANTVLGESAEMLKNTEKQGGQYDIVISNIGGVVGKAESNIINVKNEEIVGAKFSYEGSENNGFNPISGTIMNNIDSNGARINNIMQFMYVGGIAGYVESVSSEYLTIDIKNCVNSAGVYGMYAVGGLVGGYGSRLDGAKILISENEDTEELFEDKDMSNVIVLGLADVGGIIGRASELSFVGYSKSDEENNDKILTVLTFNKVIGIVNVGGIVGNATATEISNVVIGEQDKEVAIMGNLNVGGIVGLATKAINTTLIKQAEILNTTIYGTVFDYRYKTKQVNNYDVYEAYYYLPTNIGGVVGQVIESVSFNMVTTEAYVRTDENFKTGGTNEADTTECTVNMTFNHLGTTGNNAQNSYYSSSNKTFMVHLENYYSPNDTRKRYDAIESGIGGFAGTLAGKKEGNQYVNVPNFYNCSIKGNVYAYYGINVGGAIGYLACDPQKCPLPSINTENGMNVAGKIFVGGLIGKTLGFGSSQGYLFFGTFLNEVPNVNVQQYIETEDKDEDGILDEILSGSCIGGVIGYVKGNVYNIRLNEHNVIDGKSKIKVFNSNGTRLDSSYIGALVGRMDGNEMKGCEIAYQLCDATLANQLYRSNYDTAFYPSVVPEKYVASGIIQTPANYNYGGLVGLVDAPKGSKEDNALKIVGKHYYSFTVDTVQNRDYEQGKSQYSYASNPKMLSANAHYINTSDISISPSLLNDLYSSYFDGNTSSLLSTYINNHNPTNVETFGWAKEYTLFRTLARVIDQPEEETGNSVQVIYSANYVTEVFTGFALPSKAGLVEAKEIVYTIYQPLNQTAMLYCKYGIAEEIGNYDSSILDLEKGVNQDMSYEKSYALSVDYSGTWTNNKTGKTGRDAFWSHLSSHNQIGLSDEDLDKSDENSFGWKIKSSKDDDVEKVSKNYNFTFGYTYVSIATYLQRGTASNWLDNIEEFIKNPFDSEERMPTNVDFVFTTVFGAVNDGTTSLYSKSGSIFEVTGTAYVPDVSKIQDHKSWIGKAFLAYITGYIAITGTVLFVVSIFMSGGLTLALAGSIGGLAAVICGPIASNLTSSAISTANYQAEAHFTNIEDSSLGYLASSYGRGIGWENGEMDTYYDSYIEVKVPVKAVKMKEGTTIPNKLSGYEKYLRDEILKISVDNGMLSCTLPVQYFNCTTSRNMPKDINNSTTINIKDGMGIHGLLYKYGVRQIEVPKYYKVDNELYCCASEEEIGKTLYANYTDLEESKKYFDNDIIDYNGYGYILAEAANTKDVVPDAHQKYLLDTYKLNRVIEQNVMHYVTGNNTGFSADKDELRWREVQNVKEAPDKFIISKTFKCYGIKQPNSGYITRPISKIVGKTLYYREGEQDIKAITLGTGVDTSRIEIGDTLYFTLNGTGEDLEVVLQPFASGNSGLTASEMGITGNLYYAIDKEYGYISISRQFVLSSINNITKYTDKTMITSGDYIYILEEVSEDELSMIYKLHDWNGSTEEVSLSALRDNFEDYEGHYIQFKSQKSLVADIFAVENGVLYVKNLDTTYLRENIEINGVTVAYYYRPENSDLEGTSYSNRFVYNYRLEDGTMVKFYSRFYYGDDSNFFEVDLGTTESPNYIKTLLLPNSGNEIKSKEIVFSESARVSLSAKGVEIWKDYKNGDSITLNSGSITCYSETII